MGTFPFPFSQSFPRELRNNLTSSHLQKEALSLLSAGLRGLEVLVYQQTLHSAVLQHRDAVYIWRLGSDVCFQK